ncbi:MAG: hypothetical protein ACFFAS_15010 [Promethearchaeota archaeon]
MTSELEYYSNIFDNYSKIQDIDSETIKELFFNDSIIKLIEASKDIESEVFFQNALKIVSCLYHDTNINNYENQGKSADDLDSDEKSMLSSILKEEFT